MALATKVSFEDGILNEFGGDMSPFSTGSGGVDGSFYAYASGSNNVDIASTTGLGWYPSVGEPFFGHVKVLSDADNSSQGGMWFAAQSESGHGSLSGYLVQITAGGDQFTVDRVDSGSPTSLISTSGTFDPQVWYRFEISWHSSGFDAAVYDESDNEIASGSSTDTTYTSGGVGLASHDDNGDEVRYDAFGVITTPPSEPQNLSATPESDSQISLSWSEPSDWGGDDTDNYRIYRGTSSGSHSQIDSISGQTTYTDGGLVDGERYYYVVTAYNSSGESPDSNEASAVTDLPAPSNLNGGFSS